MPHLLRRMEYLNGVLRRCLIHSTRAKIFGELGFAQIIDLMTKIMSNAAQRHGISFYGFRSHAIERESFEMDLIISLELWRIGGWIIPRAWAELGF